MARLNGKLITRYTLTLKDGAVTATAKGSGARGGHYTIGSVKREDGDVAAAMGSLLKDAIEPTRP